MPNVMINPDRFPLRTGAAVITAALLWGLAGAGGSLPVVATFPDGGVVRGDFLKPSGGVNTFTFELPAVPEGAAVHVRLTGPDGQRLDVPLTALPAEEAGTEAHGAHTEAAPAAGDVNPAEHAEPVTGLPASDQDHAQSTPDHPADEPGHDGAETAAEPHADESAPHTDEPGAHTDDAAAHADAATTPQEAAHTGASATDTHEAASATTAPEAPLDGHDTAEGTDGHAHGPAGGYRGWTRVRLTPGRWTLEARMDDMPGHTPTADFTVVPGGPSPLFTGTTGLLMLGFTGFGFVHRRLPQRKDNKVTPA